MIRLAGCIITNDAGEVLLLHRHGVRSQWEIPGGKIESGEKAAQAAAREVKEELGISVSVEKPLGGQTFMDKGTEFHYSWYSAKIIAGEPAVMEPDLFDGVRYFSLDYLRSHQKLLSINVQNFLSSLERGVK